MNKYKVSFNSKERYEIDAPDINTAIVQAKEQFKLTKEYLENGSEILEARLIRNVVSRIQQQDLKRLIQAIDNNEDLSKIDDVVKRLREAAYD